MHLSGTNRLPPGRIPPGPEPPVAGARLAAVTAMVMGALARHGVTGVAQLNVSSWVAVIRIIVSIGITGMVWSAVVARAPRAPEFGPVGP